MLATHAPSTHVVVVQGSSLVGQSASELQIGGDSQHSPLPQQVKPGAQLTDRYVQDPASQRPPVQGSPSVSVQSASELQVGVPSQHSPLLQQKKPGTQLTIKVSWHETPVQGSPSGAGQSLS
jgi:hypothetical protein